MADRSSTGISDASAICARINAVNFDFAAVANEVKSLGNTVLDENGVLAKKTTDGLSDLSEAVNGLLSKKNEITSKITKRGNELQFNYKQWMMKKNTPKNNEASYNSSTANNYGPGMPPLATRDAKRATFM